MSLERLKCSGTVEERELLASAKDDRPTSGTKARVVALLGAGAVLTTTTVAEGAVLSAVSPGGAGTVGATGAGAGAVAAAVPAAPTLGIFGVLKWIGVGLVAGTSTTLVVTTAVPNEGDRVESPRRAQEVVVQSPVLRPQPEEPATTRRSDPTAQSEEPTVSDNPRRRVGEEIEVLDRVRTALRSGDTSAAQRVLREYRKEFPRGVMGPESAVLEIQAALAGGDRERAASLARSFLARYPSSPHSRQVRVFLGRATAPSIALESGRAVGASGDAPPALEASDEPTVGSGAERSMDDSRATPDGTPSVARFED